MYSPTNPASNCNHHLSSSQSETAHCSSRWFQLSKSNLSCRRDHGPGFFGKAPKLLGILKLLLYNTTLSDEIFLSSLLLTNPMMKLLKWTTKRTLPVHLLLVQDLRDLILLGVTIQVEVGWTCSMSVCY